MMMSFGDDMSSSGLLSNVAQANAADEQTTLQRRLKKMSSDWANLPAGHVLKEFQDSLPEVLRDAGYGEMYGVDLVAPGEGKPAPHTTLVILQKFLRANVGDLNGAKEQLTTALKWRKEYQPLKVKDEVFDGDKFGKLGYVTKVKGATETKNEQDVATFNIYGAAAKDVKKTFGDTDAFVRWRVALMELTIAQLNLNSADQIIPDYGQGPDPYRAIAVHDYLSVSFFRQPAEIKASSTKIIDMFQRYYPETVSLKYFVNVPLVMQWMMGAMKALMSKDSIQSMTWMTYGSELHNYLGQDIPQEYGGKGPALAEVGFTPKYGDGSMIGRPVTALSPTTEKSASDNTTTQNLATNTKPDVETPAAVPTSAAEDMSAATPTTPEISGKPAEKADVA